MQFRKTLTAALAATIVSFSAAGSPAEAQTKLGVSYQPALYWALPFYLADQKGWWAELGLEPNYSTFPSGAPQVAAAASASWDVGGTGSAPAVLGAARFDIVTIGITNNESAGNAVLVRKADLEAIKADPTTLRGERLLVTTNSTGEYAASACMESYGLSYPKDLEVVNLNQQEIISAFATGSGKLAGLWAPNIYTLEARTESVVLCSGQDAGAIVPGALIARRDYAEKNPETVARFLAVFLRGVNWIRSNQKQAVDMMADFYALSGVELPDKFLQREIDTRPMFTLQEQLDILDKSKGASTVETWFSGLGGYLQSTGTLQEAPDTATYVDPTYMKLVADTPELAAFSKQTD